MERKFMLQILIIAVCFTIMVSWIYETTCEELMGKRKFYTENGMPELQTRKEQMVNEMLEYPSYDIPFKALRIVTGRGFSSHRRNTVNSSFYQMTNFQLYFKGNPYTETFLPDKKHLQNICKVTKVKDINCEKIFDGDEKEVMKASVFRSNKSISTPSEELASQTLSCEKYKADCGYIISPLSNQEKEFPIAYSILMYKDVLQFEILLRAIYRPQNFYCIHVDLKAKSSIFQTVSMISKCFPNIYLASRRIEVTWGKFSVLEADLICMEDLLKHKGWRYFMNLTGQEFPLRTNFELVQIFSVFNGANDIKGILKSANPMKWKNAGRIPKEARPLKSCTHIAASREFVHYAIHNKTAKYILAWSSKVTVPDEFYFGVLNFSPDIAAPGAFKGNPEDKPFLARLKLWTTKRLPCYGHWVRGICIFGIKDLQTLYKQPELFANKFHHLDNPTVLECLSELLCNRTRDEYTGDLKFNTSLYERLNFVNADT